MVPDTGFNAKFWEWMSESAGVPFPLILSLEQDGDWTFVIKMFGILEAGLNHLLATHIENPEVAEILSLLDTANDRRGKIAIVKAYGLLSNESCLFVKLLAKVRSHAVHKVKHFDLNLAEYIKGDAQNVEGWKAALTSWCKPPIDKQIFATAMKHPRKAIHNSVMWIMMQSMMKQALLEQGRIGLQKLIDEHGESTPKE